MNIISMFKVIFGSIARVFNTTDNILSLGSGYIQRKAEQQKLKAHVDTKTYAMQLMAEHKASQALAIATLNEVNAKAEKPSAKTQEDLNEIMSLLTKKED